MTWWARVSLGVVLAVGIAAGLAPWQVSAAQQPGPEWLALELQRRDKESGEIVTTVEKVNPKRIGVVAVDIWNWHWCKTAAARVDAFAPRMNACLDELRGIGEYPMATIIYGTKDKPALPVSVQAEVFSPWIPWTRAIPPTRPRSSAIR